MLRADAPHMAQSIAFLEQARNLANAAAGINIYDPVPMHLSRLANRERAQLLVESANRPLLQNFLSVWTTTIHARKAPRELRWHVDVDPIEF